MNQVRRRLTYANVMSSLAVFLVLGGGAAFAALGRGSVGSKQLKKSSVTTAKIKNGAVTTAKLRNGAITGAKVSPGSLGGAQIDLSTLGTVPSAESANTVNGQAPVRVFKMLRRGESGVPVASIAGFTITASCEEENADVTLRSPATPASVIEAEGSGHEESVFEYDDAESGEASEVRLDGKAGGRGDIYGETTFSAALRNGTVLSGDIAYDWNTFGESSGRECVVFGEVTTG